MLYVVVVDVQIIYSLFSTYLATGKYLKNFESFN